MYWYRSRIKLILTGSTMLVICGLACKPGAKASEALRYFDLSGYFNKESSRLNKEHRMVFKTVAHNSVSESKKVRITNWGLELNLFKDADINKPAWKNSYTIIDED